MQCRRCDIWRGVPTQSGSTLSAGEARCTPGRLAPSPCVTVGRRSRSQELAAVGTGGRGRRVQLRLQLTALSRTSGSLPPSDANRQ